MNKSKAEFAAEDAEAERKAAENAAQNEAQRRAYVSLASGLDAFSAVGCRSQLRARFDLG